MKSNSESLTGLLNSLREQQRQGKPGSSRDAPEAACDPLVEVLLAELGAILPRPLSERLAVAGCPISLPDWLAAAAVYRTIANDPMLARRFLVELESGPREAGLALARAFAWKLEPPPRDADRVRCDLGGVVLQIGLVAAVLGTRCLLFLGLAACLGAEVDGSPASLARGLLGLDLLAHARGGGWFACALLGIAFVWLSAEAAVAPRLFEALRQGPSRWRGHPPPLAWRTDTFHVLYYLQAVILQMAVGAVLGPALFRNAFTLSPPPYQWLRLLLFGLTGFEALRFSLGSIAATLRLGASRHGKDPV